MATAEVTQNDVDVVFESAFPLQVSQYDVDVIYNYPSEKVEASQYDVDVITESPSVPVEVSQFDVDVVYRGKTYNPKLRAWTFDLDWHEFYVLRLGDNKTLVYDLSTEQWSWWSSGLEYYWRPSVGTNWVSAGAIPYYNGSNVVVGDSNFGILWMLDPEQGYDDPTQPDMREAGVIRTFPRSATGQVLTRGRVTVQCFQLYLVGNNGRPSYPNAPVTLTYSDDGGQTFRDAGTKFVTNGDYYQEFAWRSLGLIKSHGRLFRIEDDGAFAKIEELTLYDNTPEE